MRTATLIAAILLLTATACGASRRHRDAAPAAGVATVQSVYVAELGTDPDAIFARETLRNELARRGPFRVVDSAAHADAILAGKISVHRAGPDVARTHASGWLTLTNAATGAPLWQHRYRELTVSVLARSVRAPDQHLLTAVLQFVDRLQDAARAAGVPDRR